jgi:hypothetical protein
MNATQAFHILNVSPGASQVEIEQAYRAALQALQLQLVPGQPVAVRQKAQAQIAELKSAFEFLKNMAAPAVQPTWAGGPAPPQVRPTMVPQARPAAIPQAQPFAGFPVQPTAMPPVQGVVGLPVQPPAMMPNPFGAGPAAVTYPWIIPAGLVLAAAVMLSVVLLCMGPTASLKRQESARLRVLSVPWSYVTVDGQSLGPSGQVDAFALKPGEHTATLRQGQRILSQTLQLPEKSETVIKVQLEKGTIDVAHKQI